MSKKNVIVVTLLQIVAGSVIGVAGGWLCQLFFEKFILELLIGSRVTHGFWVGLFLLVSIGITYGVAIVGATEAIRFVGRKFGSTIAFKPVCSGAFLGPPAIVGLLALLNVPWEIFGRPNLLLSILLPAFKILAYLLSLPIRVWLLFEFPVEILYCLSIPVGAILGYRLSSTDRRVEVSIQET